MMGLRLSSFFVVLIQTSATEVPENDENLMEAFRSLQDQVVELQTKVIQLEQDRQRDVATADTLFLATISASSIAISDDEPIIFDSAPINPGGHFITVLGAYTAPLNGYYQFSVTKRSNANQADYWILVDEVRYAYNDLATGDNSGSSAPTASFTITLQLTAGEVVRVENDNSNTVYGTSSGVIQTWFTGYMLYAL